MAETSARKPNRKLETAQRTANRKIKPKERADANTKSGSGIESESRAIEIFKLGTQDYPGPYCAISTCFISFVGSSNYIGISTIHRRLSMSVY